MSWSIALEMCDIQFKTFCYFSMIFFFFFFFDLGFTALSRIFHLYWADHSSKVSKNRRSRGKTTWPYVSRTWLSHMWPEQGSNHSSEKPNGLKVNSPIHKAMGARYFSMKAYILGTHWNMLAKKIPIPIMQCTFLLNYNTVKFHC